MIIPSFSKLKCWQIAVLDVALSSIGGLASRQPHKKEKIIYTEELRQAPWAPPSWVFAPAWSINNFFLLLALQKLVKEKGYDKEKMLWMQSAIWFIFFSFGYVYFNKKSPLLAATWTIADAALAIASYSTALKNDKKTARYYLPLVGWTVFASSVAAYQALKNPDPFLGTKALVQ